MGFTKKIYGPGHFVHFYVLEVRQPHNRTPETYGLQVEVVEQVNQVS